MNNTTKEKLLSALAEKGITPDGSYEHNDLLEKYLSIEEVFLREIFAEGYHDKMKTQDLNTHFNGVAQQRELTDDRTYQNVINELTNLSEHIGGLKNGRKGEKSVGNSLDNLKGKSRILHNVDLSTSKGRCEYDFIVITKKGLFIVEVKYSTSPTVIDYIGNLKKVDNHNSRHCNIVNDLEDKEDVLYNSLTPALQEILPRNRIHSVMVIVGNTEVDKRCRGLAVCSHGQICKYIENYRSTEYSLNINEMDELFCYISSCKRKAYYPLEMDIERCCEDIADLIGLIDDASHNSNAIEDTDNEIEYENIEFEKYSKTVIPEVTPIVKTSEPKPKYVSVAVISAASGFAFANLPKLIKIIKNFR